MNAIDTNVFVYALDNDDPTKQSKAQELIQRLVSESESTILLWQVAGELLSNLRKRESAGRIPAADVESHFRNFLAMFPLALPTPQSFLAYFDPAARFSLSHWDAMLLAACKGAGVTTLFSEDMDSGTDFDGLTIVDPFA
jgi:predicted nucleic acid-binding protein